MLKALKKYKAPYLFILPFFILFFVFQLVPTILADRPRLYFILCTVDCMSVKQPFFKEQQRKSIFQNSYIPAKYLCSHRYGTYFPYAV